MALVSGILPNLLGGVSQQPEVLRAPNQLRQQLNFTSSVVEGLVKRAPLEYYAYLGNTVVNNDNDFFHFINRDTTERYLLILKDNATPVVYDIVNKEFKTVNTPNGVGYLNITSEPRTAFRAVTVADHTFIVNTRKTVAALSTLSPAGTEGVIVNIRIPANDITYRILVQSASFTTLDVSHTTAASGIISLKDIASALEVAIDAFGDGWAAGQVNGSIFITKSGGLPSDTTVTAWGENTEDSVVANFRRVQSFTDLVPFGKQGVIVEVAGDPGTEFDNYYVESRKFGAEGGSSVSQIEWIETVAPGIEYKLDPATMPHLLVRESDGTFTFKQATWGERTAGNLETNPWPTFVGRVIQDVFFFKNRLGFLTGENAVLSEIGEYFNFFRTTVTAQLDDDPIDVSVTTNRVANLKYAAAADKRLFAISDNLIFELEGDPLTPSSAALPLVATIPSRTQSAPIVGGSSIFIPFERGAEFAGLQEIIPGSSDGDDWASDVSGHVPRLIRGNITSMAYSGLADTVFVHSSTQDRDIWCYKTFWENKPEGREKVLSSWSQWNFGIDITHITVIDQYLYCVFYDDDIDGGPTNRVYLGRIDLREGITEDDTWDWRPLLDFRVQSDHGDVSSVFAGGNTTFTLPYRWIEADDPMWVIDMSTGEDLTPTSVDGTTGEVVFNGQDMTSETLLFGLKYSAVVWFSIPTVRTSGKDGGIPAPDGDLYLLFWSVNFAKSGRIRCRVFYPDGAQRGYTKVSSLSDLKTGGLKSGQFKFPVRAKSSDEDLIIELINDKPWPSNFINAGWEANFIRRVK